MIIRLKSWRSKGLSLKYANGQSRFDAYNDYKFLSFFNEAYSLVKSEVEPVQSLLSPTLRSKIARILTEYGAEAIHSKIHREYFEGSIKELKLCQVDPTSNFYITEAKWDLFKITIADTGWQSTLKQCETMLKI